MSLDLRLLPFDADDLVSYSHTVLSCEQDYRLFDAIADLEKTKGRTVPPGFNSFVSRDEAYEDSHYGRTTETPYGEPLQEVEVEVLLKIDAPKDGINKAIWAYLAELPPRTKVALFWC